MSGPSSISQLLNAADSRRAGASVEEQAGSANTAVFEHKTGGVWTTSSPAWSAGST